MTDSTDLTFEIDKDLCSGHGRCYSLAPQWFQADDIGYGEVTSTRVPATDRQAMEAVMAACPEGAIKIRPAD
jgi:ferredoxin